MEKLQVFADGRRGYTDDRFVVKATPVTPIYVRAVLATRNPLIVRIEIAQQFERQATGSTIVSDFLSHIPQINNSNQTETRVDWVSIDKINCAALGIFGMQPGDWDRLEEADRKRVGINNTLLRYKGADTLTGARIVATDSFTAITWTDTNSGLLRERPARQAGPNGGFLTFNGRKIYRVTKISLPGQKMLEDGRNWDEDVVIYHDNKPVSSTVASRQLAASQFSPNIMPGTVRENLNQPVTDYTRNRIADQANEAMNRTSVDMTRTTPTPDAQPVTGQDSHEGALEELESRIEDIE